MEEILIIFGVFAYLAAGAWWARHTYTNAMVADEVKPEGHPREDVVGIAVTTLFLWPVLVPAAYLLRYIGGGYTQLKTQREAARKKARERIDEIDDQLTVLQENMPGSGLDTWYFTQLTTALEAERRGLRERHGIEDGQDHGDGQNRLRKDGGAV